MFRILVFGAGSIGIFLGTKLYAAGHDVMLYGRRKLQSLTELIFINGEAYKLPPRLYQISADNDCDYIFVTTKLYDTQKAVEDIIKSQIPSKIFVFVQNGIVENNFYGELKHHPGLVTISVFNGYNLTQNQIIVRETKTGLKVEDTFAGKQVCKLLISVGINCSPSSEIEQIRACKFLFNSATNALSAIEKKSLGDLIIDEKLKKIVDGIIKEGWEVLKDEYNLPTITSLKEDIYSKIRQVREHYSSMYQDLTSRRKTEIEFLNGLIIKLGKKKGIPTPYNQKVYRRILEDEMKSQEKNLVTR
jgi:2-dehydropantoate 2-reductase